MKKLTKRPQYISTIVSEKDDPRADRACQFLAVIEAWGLEAWDFFWTSSPEIIPSPVILVTLAQLRLSDDAIVINNVVNDIPVDHVHWKTCVDRSSNSTMDLPKIVIYHRLHNWSETLAPKVGLNACQWRHATRVPPESSSFKFWSWSLRLCSTIVTGSYLHCWALGCPFGDCSCDADFLCSPMSVFTTKKKGKNAKGGFQYPSKISTRLPPLAAWTRGRRLLSWTSTVWQ